MDAVAMLIIGLLFLSLGLLLFLRRHQLADGQSESGWMRYLMWEPVTRSNLTKRYVMASAASMMIGLYVVVVAALKAMGP